MQSSTDQSAPPHVMALLSSLSQEAQQLIRAEAQVAIIEAQSSLRRYRQGAVAFGLAGILLSAAYIGTLIAVSVLVLNNYPDRNIMFWSTVAVLHLVAGLAALFVVHQRTASHHNFPTETLQSFQQTAAALKGLRL